MFKKILFLFTIVFVLVLFEECKKDEFPYGIDSPSYFLRKDMKVTHSILKQNYYRATTPFNVDTSEQYVIILDFDMEYTARAKTGFSSFFINTAYATEPIPEPGNDGAKDTITSIIITSDSTYDSIHIAGTILNSFFRTIKKNDDLTKDSLQASHIDNHSKTILLIPAIRPSINFTHKFNVEIKLSNGLKFFGTTPPVTFK